MKFSAVLAIAAATGYVSAQDISSLPSCSLSCLLTAVTATGCSTTDFKCSCGKSAQLTSSVTPCIQKSCSAADQATTITQLESICQQAGVPISIAAPGASSAPASSAVPASSVPASSAAPASSAPAASTPAGYSSVASSAASVASSAASVASSAASVASAASSAASSGYASATTAAPVPSSPSSNGTATSVYTGGAAQATGLPVILAAAAAALYVL